MKINNTKNNVCHAIIIIMELAHATAFYNRV